MGKLENDLERMENTTIENWKENVGRVPPVIPTAEMVVLIRYLIVYSDHSPHHHNARM